MSKNLNKQFLFSIIALVCLIIITHLPIEGKQVPLRRNFEDFPAVIGQWRQHSEDKEMVSASATEHVTREYMDHSGRIIRLYTHYIEKQTQGRETTINIRYHLPELSGIWQVIDEKIDLLEIPGHLKGEIKVNRCIIENGSRKIMILYWYQVGGTYTANIYRAKILSTLYAIFRNRRDGAFIYLSTPVTHSVDASREILRDFGKLAIPILTDYLPI